MKRSIREKEIENNWIKMNFQAVKARTTIHPKCSHEKKDVAISWADGYHLMCKACAWEIYRVNIDFGYNFKIDDIKYL